MLAGEYGQFTYEKGSVSFPCWLLEKYQALDIAPEELGYLLLAMYQLQKTAQAKGHGTKGEPYPLNVNPGDNPWVGKALEKGWAKWSGDGEGRRVVLDPIWQQLYHLWETEQEAVQREESLEAGRKDGRKDGFGEDFDYSRIVKELDRLRGSLSVTVREQQLIQEFNIKYGWSTDFILHFFRLCSGRNLMQIKNYRPLAAQIYRSGIFTLEGLEAFMNEVDWISKQAAEIKKDYLGLYGMVTVMERDYYVKWHITWKFSHTLIVRAARESAGAANATFKYIDSIMARWHELGADTLEACEEAIRVWQEEKKEQAKARSAANRKSRAGASKPAKEREASPWSGFSLEGAEEQ
ncbi:MAG: DnaD domain protein [Clostridiales bacterium]|nr:DnaD domain protein [Clostridiales bacterium]